MWLFMGKEALFRLQLTLILIINESSNFFWFIVESFTLWNVQKWSNTYRSLTQLKVMFSDILFGLSNSPKPENIQFTTILNREKQQFFTVEKLKQEYGFGLILN